MSARTTLAKLRRLERRFEEATSVHMRPYVLREAFEREAAAVERDAAGDADLIARVAPRLQRLRARLEPPGADAG